ncbi:MAG: class I SAM-dependent methyltransferase [Candidatus Hodarchaeales archaeon]|jgi:ubiquinone/menaquinone biosynthesis C-methylase UbiE
MNKTEKFWDKRAKNYDKGVEKDETIRRLLVDKARIYLKPDDIIIDIACGTGFFSHELAVNVKWIYAIDISSKMIGIAKDKGNNRQIQNISYHHSTIFDDKLKTNSFDAILAFYILHLLPNTEKVLERIAELLKPGGLLISYTSCIGEKSRMFRYSLFLQEKLQMAPYMRPFSYKDLEELVSYNFDIEKTKKINPPNFYIVAKK